VTENPFAWFDRAAGVADEVIARVKPDQFGDPTPCREWSVRQVINHVVLGNMLFTSMVTGDPPPDRTQDQLGDDPLMAFRDTLLALRSAFSADGVLEATYPTPFGEGPGTLLVHMRTMEMTIHGWDIARATGQSTDLDSELAEFALASMRRALTGDRAKSPFGPEQPAPAGATAADRLAAFAGRVV
jgi:uncharacterized protein (TIGR03086 family)